MVGSSRVLVPPEQSPAADFAFDVTPARLVTGFITERGVCGASETEIHHLFSRALILPLGAKDEWTIIHETTPID